MKKTALALALLLALLATGSTGTQPLESVSANYKPYPPPAVTFVSPAKNGVIPQSNIPIEVKVEAFRFSPSSEFESVAWLNYSLDGQADVAAAVSSPYFYKDTPGEAQTATGALTGLSDGYHSLMVHGETNFKKYFNDAAFSATVYFTVDTVKPTVKVFSPVPLRTYTSVNLSLNYFVNEPVSWAGYSLDKDANVTSRINATLTNLSFGMHTLKVYANDSAGNQASSNSIVFTVKDIQAPAICILSVENKTYNTTDIPLNFTIDKPKCSMAYCLDNQANVTVMGNSTLLALSGGVHTLTVYANDTAGNIGASDTITFNVVKEQEPAGEVFPVSFAFASVMTAVVGISLTLFLSDRRQLKKQQKKPKETRVP
jgi:hypothetical protein